jgi:hypothetical protein
MMRGHYAYYGITGNFERLSWYAHQAARIWQKWLSRRDRQRPLRGIPQATPSPTASDRP